MPCPKLEKGIHKKNGAIYNDLYPIFCRRHSVRNIKGNNGGSIMEKTDETLKETKASWMRKKHSIRSRTDFLSF